MIETPAQRIAEFTAERDELRMALSGLLSLEETDRLTHPELWDAEERNMAKWANARAVIAKATGQ